jgi:hypothetical protein
MSVAAIDCGGQRLQLRDSRRRGHSRSLGARGAITRGLGIGFQWQRVFGDIDYVGRFAIGTCGRTTTTSGPFGFGNISLSDGFYRHIRCGLDRGFHHSSDHDGLLATFFTFIAVLIAFFFCRRAIGVQCRWRTIYRTLLATTATTTTTTLATNLTLSSHSWLGCGSLHFSERHIRG